MNVHAPKSVPLFFREGGGVLRPFSTWFKPWMPAKIVKKVRKFFSKCPSRNLSIEPIVVKCEITKIIEEVL